MRPEQARAVWHRLETINAVAYFSDECRRAPEALGLTGFWMGYFACRAAPMGAVVPAVVEATFANFHPRRVRNAVPEAWERAEPETVVGARSAAAAAALRRLLDGDVAEELAKATTTRLRQAIEDADPTGRPLFAANRDVAVPADPVAALWQVATTLREHRGDAHVALLAAEGLRGLDAHVLFAAGEGVGPELYLQSRGWAEDDWSEAVNRLGARGLVTPNGTATEAGRALRTGIERRTDELAAGAYRELADDEVDELLDRLEGPARTIAGAGEIRYPNPMGLPAV